MRIQQAWVVVFNRELYHDSRFTQRTYSYGDSVGFTPDFPFNLFRY
jgi:hypothetical protein